MPFTPRQILVVSDVFEFQDGSIHLAPSVPFAVVDHSSGDRLKAGDLVELRRPDGTKSETTLYGLDHFTPCRGTLGIALNKPITKADLPSGTEIWRVG